MQFQQRLLLSTRPLLHSHNCVGTRASQDFASRWKTMSALSVHSWSRITFSTERLLFRCLSARVLAPFQSLQFVPGWILPEPCRACVHHALAACSSQLASLHMMHALCGHTSLPRRSWLLLRPLRSPHQQAWPTELPLRLILTTLPGPRFLTERGPGHEYHLLLLPCRRRQALPCRWRQRLWSEDLGCLEFA